jgi:hypothetical protein
MNNILKDLAVVREFIKGIDHSWRQPYSLEMHPMMYSDIYKAFRRDIYIGYCDLPPFEFYGLKLLTNPKLKHWACLVRDAQGKVIKVLRIEE